MNQFQTTIFACANKPCGATFLAYLGGVNPNVKVRTRAELRNAAWCDDCVREYERTHRGTKLLNLAECAERLAALGAQSPDRIRERRLRRHANEPRGQGVTMSVVA